MKTFTNSFKWNIDFTVVANVEFYKILIYEASLQVDDFIHLKRQKIKLKFLF